MKNKILLTALTILGIAGTTVVPTQAEGVEELCEKLKANGYVINAGQVDSVEKLEQILKECGIELGSFDWKDCPLVEIPGVDAPETEMPETEQPETEVPETNAPETEAPETEAPETNVPETELPETEVPETNAPETPGTETPDTEAPGTSNPDTESRSYAQQVVDLVNAERAKAGLHALTLDENIASAALVRAKETEISFSHTRPDGRSFSTVLSDQGITFRGAGENIAWGQRSPEEVMEGWMNSEGHRANILNEKFTKIGVGYYQNGSGRNYWTQLFTF